MYTLNFGLKLKNAHFTGEAGKKNN